MPDPAATSAGSRPAAMPRIRKMGLSFDQVPRRWFFDSTFVTHSANALNMLFPAGERMFVRSVKHYLPQITSPTLKARVRAFFGQEGSHGHEHERAFQILEAQGYEIRPWLERYERLAFQWLEPSFPPVLRLSTTVALEHFTAAMAEVALTEDFLDHAHPTMQQLLRWHAAEEIEHKSVAFDVLQQVDPRYAVRMVGMVLGLVGLLAFWHSGTQMLLRQEKDYSRAKRRQERKAARARGQDRKAIAKALVEYLRPGFHPDDRDTSPLARAYLEQIGRLEG